MQLATLTDATFTGVIVPNGISGNKLRLSLCLELNLANNSIDGTDDWRNNFPKWCSKVGDYHKQRGRLIDAATRGFQCDGKPVTSELEDEKTKVIDPKVADLWTAFLSLKAAIDTKWNDFPRQRSKPETISGITGADLLNTTFPVIEHGKSSLDISPELILNDIRRGPRLQGLRSLNASERAGIRTAYEVYRNNIQERSGFKDRPQIKDAHQLATQTLVDMQLMAKRFQLTPEYVRGAHNQLVSSPGLRRLFGTTIDFEVSLKEVPIVGRSFRVTLTLPDDDLGKYFRIEDADMLLAAPVTEARVLLAAPATTGKDQGHLYQTYFVNSIMVLGGNARTYSFDPQAAAKAADEAQEFVASLSDEQRVPTRKWDLTAGLIKKMRGSTGHPLSAEEALEMASSLEKVERDGKQLALLRRLNNQIANLPTIGHSLYLPEFRWSEPDPDPPQPRGVREHEVVRGYVVYVRTKDEKGVPTEWMSLTCVNEGFVWWDAKDRNGGEAQPEPPGDGEIGIHVGGGVHTQEKEGAPISRIDDGFLFTWPGTGLSLRSPMIHHESEGLQSGAQELANHLARLCQAMETTNPEDIAIQLNNRKLFGVDWFPFKKFANPPQLLARRTFPPGGGRNKVRLSFGNEYQYLVVAQYQNGYVPINKALLNDPKNKTAELAKYASDWDRFLRQEHIKEVLVGLEEDIYSDAAQTKLKPQHPGESPVDLVVRTGELLSNGECIRFILPPPIPAFQTYLWYSHGGLLKMGGTNRTMGLRELAHWHRRYACDARTPEEFAANKRRCKERNDILPGSGGKPHGCRAHCDQFCGGTQQTTVWDGVLAYLPDPVVTGFVAEFFLDKECLRPAPGFESQFCQYSAGRYPQLKPWRLVLHRLPHADEKGSRVEQDVNASRLRVYLEEGAQLFLRIVPAYDAERAHFAEPLVNSKAIPFPAYSMEATKLSYDLLHANAKILSLTHAVQRPLFDPVIQRILIHRYNEGPPELTANPELASTIGVSVNLHMEHLNVHFGGVAIPGIRPTGELELYALWDDFGERGLKPVKSIEDKRDPASPSGGFVRLAGWVFESRPGGPAPQPVAPDGWRQGEARNYWTTVAFRAESGTFNSTHFTDAVFKVRNGSKFHRYFHLEAPPQSAGEAHVRWSKEFRLSSQAPRVVHADPSEVCATFMPNNRKPEAPRIRKIVPLVIDDRDEQDTVRSIRGGRVRVYLEPHGRMHSGEAERVGVVVHEEYGIYNGHLAEFKSKAGRDIVTDCTMADANPALHGDQLTAHEFGLEPAGLEAEYLARFRPEYDRKTFGDTAAIGLVSYVPQFDTHQGLWYFDPEIRIRNRRGQELHDAFVQLGLITYQPWSANYNSTLEDKGYKQDLRVSPPVKADFFSVDPTRECKAPYVLFGSDDRQRFSLGGSVSSLFFQKVGTTRLLAGQFILVVQEKDTGGFWKNLDSRLTTLEFLLDGATLAERDFRAKGAPSSEALGPYHCLLPWALGDYLAEEQLTTSRFECALALDFEVGFLRAKHGGHYRVVVYEVEWFNYDPKQPMKMLAESLRTADPAQLPGVRIKQAIIFN